MLLLLVLAHPQNSQKSLLRNIDLADPLHPLLAFFLLFQQLAFAGDVAAVALRKHVLAQGAHRLAGHDLGADGGLDGHFKLLPRNQLAHLRHQRLAPFIGKIPVHDD